ncbi:hypothetical protein GCM10027073_34880 [Streptomyces chlorus]
MRPSNRTPVAGVRAIGMVVSDMAASVAFYRRFGFAFPGSAYTPGWACGAGPPRRVGLSRRVR